MFDVITPLYAIAFRLFGSSRCETIDAVS